VVAILPIEKLYLVRTRSEAAAETFWPAGADGRASGRTPSRAAGQTAELPGGKERIMMDGMGGMGWMTGGVWLVWLLAIVALVLAIVALVKYLRSK
jgi:hypothetical protein